MDSFWDWFGLMVWWFVFLTYLVLLWHVCGDLFRDTRLGGWAKAAWIVALIVLPYLSILVYVIARGRGMTARHATAREQARERTEEYIRETAGRSPADEIARAKALLDSGAISADEFGTLKQRALAG
ncbi:SHOCT domain-containing protein [Cellulomonas triticagri]|nr:SHOCT domain-containing protein [Cellulomonas triticagri]